MFVVFDSHPRPDKHPHGAAFIFKNSASGAARHVADLLRYDERLLHDSTVQWQAQLLAHCSGDIFVARDSHMKNQHWAELALDALFVTTYGLNTRNMLLPSAGVRARKTKLQMTRGWLVGEVTVLERAELVTQSGDAATHVRVHPAPAPALGLAPVTLLTTTGAGRTDVEFVHAHGAPHRPIDATHHSSLNGELYLTYADAAFNGTVEIAAKSFSATNLHNALGQEEGLPWYGSREGADRMRVKTQGWAGLYF